MKNLKLPLILACCMFLLSGGTCKFGENFYGYDIANNSNIHLICYQVLEPGYRDTTLPSEKPYVIGIRPRSMGRFTSQVSYEETFKKLPRDTMSFYFFDFEVFNNVDWSEVRENRMFLMRYELSLEDLRRLNFKIPYPPTEAMRDMKTVTP